MSKFHSAQPIPDDVNAVAKIVVDAAFRVHSTLGPGLLEKVYETCLAYELRKRGLTVHTQVELPVIYDGVHLDAGMRIDMIVAENLLIELKAVEMILPVHKAQLLTYLKLTGHRLGLLINFNVPIIRDGIDRLAL
ncbi:MAG: GxxExxY protein [Phycisphaerae bacterium]|nr:GxxExxY protein [Phycisphaerae bacterium]